MTISDVASHQLNAKSRQRCLMSFSQAPILPCSRALLFVLLLCTLALLLCFPSVGYGGWVRQTSNTTLQLNDVCFVDSLYGWAVGGRWAWPDTTISIALRTTDGGTSWLKSWEAFGLGQLKTVTFVSRLHGWAMADSALTVETTDGGVSWHNLPIIAYTFVPFAERFVNDTLGYALGGCRSMGLLDWSNIWWTTNGGLTWSIRVPRAQQPVWLVGLDVQGPRWAWATGAHDSMVLTRDAASTWLVNYLPDSGSWNVGVAFGDTAIGVAVGYRLILQTTDCGLTWTQRPKPVPKGFNSVDMPDTGHAWACGEGGTIIASSDGGMTWSAQTSGSQLMLWKIWFVNERQGWAVGDSGVILHTNDGGRSGLEESTSSDHVPLHTFCVQPNPFVAVASVPGHSTDRFALFDVSGRRVGTYRGDRIGEGLAPGVYFIRADKGDRKPIRIVKVR